jgi:predicted house-cleaning noncanonical NTP pyrophosphatase (MazG superfamily)
MKLKEANRLVHEAAKKEYDLETKLQAAPDQELTEFHEPPPCTDLYEALQLIERIESKIKVLESKLALRTEEGRKQISDSIREVADRLGL